MLDLHETKDYSSWGELVKHLEATGNLRTAHSLICIIFKMNGEVKTVTLLDVLKNYVYERFEADKKPDWYQADELFAWLRRNGYAHEVAEKISVDYAKNLNAAYNKGAASGQIIKPIINDTSEASEP